MSRIGNIGLPQYQQYLAHSQSVHAQSNTRSEEANESQAEKVAEAKRSTSQLLDTYA